MTTRKTILQIDSAGDGTTVGDTGGPVFGSIDQLRWIPDSYDTGPGAIVTMQLILMPKFSSDTGVGHVIFSQGSLVSNSNIHRAPRQSIHTTAGVVLDTGGDDSEPFYGAGDTVRAKLIPATDDTGAINGELHVWHGSLGGVTAV